MADSGLDRDGPGALRPRAVFELDRRALEWAGGSVQRLEDAFDEVFGVLPCGDDVVSSSLPPEILPFLSRGREGPHFGHLVLAPELGLADAPVVLFGPEEPVRVFASSTRDALAQLALLQAEEDDELDLPLARGLAVALDLPERPAPAPRSFVPEIPVGYRWRPGRDGLGVLARASAFGPDEVPLQEGLSLAEIDTWTSRLLYAGLPAAACAVLKDAFSVGHAQPATWDRLARAWVASYEALDRPGLADRVRRRTARFG